MQQAYTPNAHTSMSLAPGSQYWCEQPVPPAVAAGAASPCVWAVVELDAWEAACELAAARDPADGAALVKQVDGVK